MHLFDVHIKVWYCHPSVAIHLVKTIYMDYWLPCIFLKNIINVIISISRDTSNYKAGDLVM